MNYYFKLTSKTDSKKVIVIRQWSRKGQSAAQAEVNNNYSDAYAIAVSSEKVYLKLNYGK